MERIAFYLHRAYRAAGVWVLSTQRVLRWRKLFLGTQRIYIVNFSPRLRHRVQRGDAVTYFHVNLFSCTFLASRSISHYLQIYIIELWACSRVRSSFLQQVWNNSFVYNLFRAVRGVGCGASFADGFSSSQFRGRFDRNTCHGREDVFSCTTVVPYELVCE